MKFDDRTKAERLARIAGGELFETSIEGHYVIRFNHRGQRDDGHARVVDHHDDVTIISDVAIAVQF